MAGSDYRGMSGVLDGKAREAVDGLIRLLSEVCRYPLGEQPNGRTQTISVCGSFTRCRDLDNAERKEFVLWRVAEISFQWDTTYHPRIAGVPVLTRGEPSPPMRMGGASVMCCDPENLGKLAACENYLTEFHTEPYTPVGWESAIDLRLEAEDAIRALWKE